MAFPVPRVTLFPETSAGAPTFLWSGAAIDPDQQRALAIGAWYADNWHAYQDTLTLDPGWPESDTTPREQTIDGLREWWGVTSAEELHDQMRWLYAGGHDTSYRRVHPLVEDALATPDPTGLGARQDEHRDLLRSLAYYRDLESGTYLPAYDAWLQARKLGVDAVLPTPPAHGIAAWDLTRAVFLVRAGHTAGYLAEEEARPLLGRALELTREEYATWRQFASAYLWGFAFWQAQHDLSEVQVRVQQRRRTLLALLTGPESPWVRFPLGL